METRRETRRRLHVVTLVDTLGLIGGGGERLAREIAMRLDRERFQRTLCVTRWGAERARDPAAKPVLDELREAGVHFLGLPRERPFDVFSWRPLVRLIRRGKVDIVHSHKFGSNAWAAALRPVTGTPVLIAHEHTWSFQGQPVRKFLDRHLVARAADVILTVSTEDRRRMIEIEGISPETLLFVPNGISAPAHASRRDLRAELGIPPSAPVVGTVCALRPQKAVDVLIRAAARLRESIPELRVLIVGDGEERAALERLVAESGLSGTVTLLGQRSDVPDLLNTLDIAVCCSDFEGTPLSVLEYMEAALPVVATRVGGVPDLIEPGVHGLLVRPQDPDGLGDAIAALIADGERRAKMGLRARERRRSEFDISTMVATVEGLYERLAASRISDRAGA